MKYKYLRFRIIFPTLLILVLAFIVILFFIDGLKASTVTYDNIEWTSDGFITPVSKIENNVAQWQLNGVKVNEKKLVGQTDKYAMYIDEMTTIISIYKKLEGWTEEAPVEELLYRTANPNGTVASEKSNISVNYYDSNGKDGSALSSFDKSVNYENKLAGSTEKHYSLRYNSEKNYVDILYEIGDFTNILETFPKYFERTKFEELFVGNIFFDYLSDSDSKAERALQPITVEKDGALIDAYQITLDKGTTNGYAICFDNVTAEYIIQNGLGKASYRDSANMAILLTYDSPTTDTAPILEAKGGYWEITDTFDSEGNFKFELGVNCNCNSSPVRYNPFLNLDLINKLTLEQIYPVYYDNETDNGKEQVSTTFLDREHFENGYHLFKADSAILSNLLYKYLVVGDTSLVTTTQVLPKYLQVSEVDYDKFNMLVPQQYHNQTDDKPVYYDYNKDGVITENEIYVFGGFQARDPQGNYLFIDENDYIFYFDEDGNRVLNDDEGVAQPVESDSSFSPLQSGLTKDITLEQNELFGYASEAESKAFRLALRFELAEDGLNVTLMNGSVIEGLGKDYVDEDASNPTPIYFKHENKISKVEICKFLTANNDATAVGNIIIPDGSGCSISFNSVKDDQFIAKYSEKFIYGGDMSSNFETRREFSQPLMFPMYGFLETGKGKGIVAIIDKGASQSSITADFKRSSTKSGISTYNYAHFTTYLRNSEKVNITATASYNKIGKKLYESDVVYTYKFLLQEGEQVLDYVDVANVYRNYLVDKYDLDTNKDVTKKSTPTFVFIGAYEKRKVSLGIVYDAECALTTFEQAGKIIEDLTSKGIDSMNINYDLWTDDEGRDKISDNFEVSSVLGGKEELKKLTEKVKDLGYNMFLKYNLTRGSGYDFPFGSIKYNAKSISGSQTSVIEYVMSTGLADTSRNAFGRISPVFISSLMEKYLVNYNKLGINGISVIDLGNECSSDFSSSRETVSGDGQMLQMETLKLMKENGKTVMLAIPFDYTFKYVDIASEVPIEATLYPIVDYSIPLYQLVCSGLFDYNQPYINFNNDNSIQWNILKALETGSNLEFEISATDTNELLDTFYTSHYNSYYSNWNDKIVYMNKVLNDSGIYKSRLVDHEFITDTLVKVTYEDGLTILANYSDSNYVNQEAGYSVRANWFAVINKGKE